MKAHATDKIVGRPTPEQLQRMKEIACRVKELVKLLGIPRSRPPPIQQHHF